MFHTRIDMLLIKVTKVYHGTFGIEHEIFSIYNSFTSVSKRITLHYGVCVKDPAYLNGVTLFQAY